MSIEQMKQVQYKLYPDTRIVARSEAVRWVGTPYPNQSNTIQIATTAQYEEGFFYECMADADGSYKCKGFRYGVEPHEYIAFCLTP